MAELREAEGSRSCLLMTEHLVGRGPQCALRLAAGYVSSQHALIRWDGRSWQVLDRGSRNGTQLNGEALEPGRAYRLTKGSVLTFGHPQERWTLADAGEPEVMVVALDTGETQAGSQGIIGLPPTPEPECTLYQAGDGSWQLETLDGAVLPINDGDTFQVSGRMYRFSQPISSDLTEAPESAARAEPPLLHFLVSSDEDFVELTLHYGNRSVALGSRAHNYLLLTLARHRLAEQALDTPAASCGWMDKEVLADGLRVTPQQVDGEIFRIRKHFLQHGILESSNVIERRARTKLIRIGFDQLKVERRG